VPSAPRKSSKAASKPAPRKYSKPKGQPAKATKGRTTAPSASRKAGRAAPAKPPGSPGPSAPEPVWTDLPDAEAWQPVASPRPDGPPPKPFDPATGDWIAVEEPKQVAEPPESTRPGTWTVVLHVLFALDLIALGANLLLALAAGAILIFAPDSSNAQMVRDALEIGSSRALFWNVVFMFLMVGGIPFLWVLGTRRVPWEGTKRFLRLHSPGPAILRGVLLTIPLLIAVAILSSVYIIATEGVEALTESAEGDNPAVDALLAHLTWPLAILIALGAGVGEEILFRGILTRYTGIWGSAALFGLAHATGGYLPQIVFAFGLGVLFAWLLKRGWSLWTLITAHTLYDLVLLGLALTVG
jgi:membrane protease YdiL (CAAX protease family)